MLALIEILRYRKQLFAWNAWLAFHNAKIDKEELFLSILSHMLNQKMGGIIDAWFEHTQWKLRLGQVKETVVKRIRFYNLYTAFTDWVEMVNARKDKLLRCVKALRSRRLLYSFNGFCFVVSEMKIKRLKVKMSLKKLQRREVSKAVLAWVERTRRSKYVKDALTNALVRTRLGRVMKAFGTWRDQVARMKKVKTKITRAARFLVEKRLTFHFEKWKQLWISRLREKLSWMESIETIEAQKISRLFHKWFLKKRKKEYMRKVLIHWKKVLLSKCLTTWSTWSKKRATKRSLLQTVITKLKGNQTSHGFHAWVTYVRIKQRHKQIVFSWRNKRMLYCFLSWKNKMLQTGYQADQLQAIVKKWKNECKARALSGWMSSIVQIKEKKIKAKSALTFWLKRHTKKAFLALRDNALEMKQLNRALSHMVSRTESKVLCGWLYYIDKKKRLESMLHQALDHMQGFAKGASFHKWMAYVSHREQRRLVMERASLRMVRTVCKRGFRSWLLLIEDKKTKLHNIGVCLTYWKSRLRLMSLRKWREWAEYKIYVEGVIRQSLAKLSNSVAHKSFLSWQDHVAYSQHKRENLEKAIAFWNKQQIAFLFLWKAFVEQKKANNLKIEVNLRRIFFKRVYDAFLYWGFWTHQRHEKQTKLLQSIQFICNRRLAKGFQSWKDLIPWMVSSRKKVKLAIGHWSLRTKLVYYLNWYDYAEKMNVVRINTRRAYLSKAMRGWTYACRRKMELAYILQVALMRWAYRETVRSWEKLKENRVNSKLKRRAVAHFRSARSASALRRWVDYKEETIEMKAKADKAVLYWKNWRLTSSFAGWHETSIILQRQKETLQHVMRKWQQAQQRHYFLFLLTHTQEKQALRVRAILSVKSSKLSKSFASWFDYAHWQPSIRKAVRHWRGRAYVTSFDKWTAYRDRNLAKKSAISHHERSYKSKAIVDWIDYTNKQRREQDNLRRALWLFRRNVSAKGYYSWRDRATKLISDRQKVLQSLSLIRRNTKSHTYRKWVAYTLKRRQKALAMKHACRVLKRSMLRLWLVNSEFLRGRRHRCERLQRRVTSRMMRMLSHKAMDSWLLYTHRSKSLKRILYRVQKRKALHAYNSWTYCGPAAQAEVWDG